MLIRNVMFRRIFGECFNKMRCKILILVCLVLYEFLYIGIYIKYF